MLLKISHVTRYAYDAPMSYGLQQLRLTPQTQAGQRVIGWETSVEGGRKETSFTDQHENFVQLIGLEAGCTEIVVRSAGEVETTDLHGVTGPHTGRAPLWLYQRSTPLTAPGARVRALLREIGDDHASDIERLHALMRHILEHVRYDLEGTDVRTTAEAAIKVGRGVCQDHAHIFVACARLLGFPSRYVSGYLMMRDRIDQEASHAWAESFIPDLGWVGFDVANGISPDECYVRIATGLDSAEAAPITGMTMGRNAEAMNVTLQVQQ